MPAPSGTDAAVQKFGLGDKSPGIWPATISCMTASGPRRRGRNCGSSSGLATIDIGYGTEKQLPSKLQPARLYRVRHKSRGDRTKSNQVTSVMRELSESSSTSTT